MGDGDGDACDQLRKTHTGIRQRRNQRDKERSIKNNAAHWALFCSAQKKKKDHAEQMTANVRGGERNKA